MDETTCREWNLSGLRLYKQESGRTRPPGDSSELLEEHQLGYRLVQWLPYKQQVGGARTMRNTLWP